MLGFFPLDSCSARSTQHLSLMENIIQHIILVARTLQGVTPIFVEYALWISLAGLLVFILSETLARLLRYNDWRVEWIARAYGVSTYDVLPIASSALLGQETIHPTKKIKNPFKVGGQERSPHQGDFIVRGNDGAVVASVYNWRGCLARNARKTQKPGRIELVETTKARYVSGFLRELTLFSPDEDVKTKAATLSAALVGRHGAQSRFSAMCLHKNRPPHLATRSPIRDANGNLAAHIDIEQIRGQTLPTGIGGRIDDETWYDLRGWMLRQPGRMTSPSRTSARVASALVLLAIFAYTEASTISDFEIEILIEYVQSFIVGHPQTSESPNALGAR